MATKPLIKESLFSLNTCGLNPEYQNSKTKIAAVLSMILIIHFLTELTLDFALEWKGWESVDGFEIYVGFCLVLFKIITMMVNGGKMRALLKSLTEFWSCKDYGPKIQNEIENVFLIVKRLMMIYVSSPVLTVTAYVLVPLLGATRSLPFRTYHPSDYYKSYNYQTMYFLQVIYCVIGIFSMCGFDILFLSFITHIICECKLLKQGFLNIKIKNDCRNNLMEVKRLVAHHNLILKCVQDLDKIYSRLILIQFLFSLLCLCTGLLNIVVSGFSGNLHRLIISVSYMAACLGQLLIYCVAGTYLKTESESVCDAVYKSGWWVKTQPQLRRAYTLIIQRAQRGEELTAGGMFPVNLISFTRIMKACMSFFMLAQALYGRSTKE